MSDAPVPAVQRLALCQRVRRGSNARLVLLRAPAGHGKTTAMAQLRAQFDADGLSTAWLTLLPDDDTPARFVARLGAALAAVQPPGQGGRDTGPGGEDAPTTPAVLLQRLASGGRPFALFLDDFCQLRSAEVLGLVREAVEQLPGLGRLVIGARGRPALGLARLRAHGQLLELDITDLRFSLAETERFFAARPLLPLGTAALQRLHHKTEGWPAALAIAGEALLRQPSGDDLAARFSGAHPALGVYLAQVLLEPLPPPDRDFLLRTSLLRQLVPALCDQLVPGAHSAETLARLAAEHQLVRPGPEPSPGAAGQSAGARHWVCHGLVADFLRARLRRDDPDLATRLHLAACGWYEAQGRAEQAIEHAVEGGDLPHAAALLAGCAEAFIEQGRLRLLRRWLDALPPALVADQPWLQLADAWSGAFIRAPLPALDRLQAARLTEAADPALRAHAQALLPMLLAMRDRHEEAAAIGQAALARLPSGRPFADILLANTMAHVLATRGQLQPALAALEQARRTPHGDTAAGLYTETSAGLVDLYGGRLQMAGARLRLVAGPGREMLAADEHPVHGRAWAGVLQACTCYEAGQVAQARQLLHHCQPLVRDLSLPDHLILTRQLGARIAFLLEGPAAAARHLDELEALGRQRDLPRLVAAAWLERARQHLLQGQARAAREALDQADLPGLWQRVRAQRLVTHDVDDLLVARLRWQIAFGDAAAALPALTDEAAQACGHGRPRRRLVLGLLQALAEFRTGRVAAALATAATALRAARDAGTLRLVLDEGPALQPLLLRLHAQLLDAPDAQTAPDQPLADYVAGLLREGGQVATTPTAADTREALTRQEVRILQLLADGCSNDAMAQALAISNSTVRTHLRSIHLKLDVHSRIQAVAAARRLAVIR